MNWTKRKLIRFEWKFTGKKKMTDSQKQKIKEQDKKHSAKHHLEKKMKNEIKKQNARDHKRKSIISINSN